MGLDAVELVLRTEEFFGIDIQDDEAEAVRSVGDLYILISVKLNLPPLDSPITSTMLPVITEREKAFLFFYKSTPLPAPPEVLPWSSQSVWDCLVAIVVDELGLRPDEVQYHARFVEDLGVD